MLPAFCQKTANDLILLSNSALLSENKYFQILLSLSDISFVVQHDSVSNMTIVLTTPIGSGITSRSIELNAVDQSTLENIRQSLSVFNTREQRINTLLNRYKGIIVYEDNSKIPIFGKILVVGDWAQYITVIITGWCFNPEYTISLGLIKLNGLWTARIRK